MTPSEAALTESQLPTGTSTNKSSPIAVKAAADKLVTQFVDINIPDIKDLGKIRYFILFNS